MPSFDPQTETLFPKILRMRNLPPDIIADIFSRLPVKALLRFRLVSKPWRSMLSSKEFIKLHLQQTVKSNSHRFLLVEKTFEDLFSVDLDSLERMDLGELPVKYHCVVNSCNGLVLAASDNHEPLLWNPSTRKHKILPPTPVELSGDVDVCFNKMYGFGYDSKSDDYKVVRVTEIGDERTGEYMYSETKIYSLKSNSWKRVEDFPHILPTGKRVWGVYLNDALHTVVTHCCTCHNKSILAFDLGTSENRLVPNPDLLGENIGVASAEVIGGHLATLVPRKMNTTEVWVMKEYGVKESWTKLLSFRPPMPEPYMSFAPLAYSKGGDEVFLNYDGRCLFAYHLRKKKTRIVNVPGLVPQFYDVEDSGSTFSYFGSTFHAEVCFGSLVSLDSPDEAVQGQKENPQGKKKKKKQKGNNTENRDDFLSVGFKLVL